MSSRDPTPCLKSTADFLTSKMVTVLAGPSRVPYHVHHDVLCARSAHCQIALEGPFAEAQSGEMTFPEEDPDTIKLFLHWVYHLALPRCHYPVDLQTYISLMSFAHSILLEELQNTCMDSIRAAFREQSQGRETRTVGGEELAMAYETTAELPKLRFFVCFQAALQRTLNRSAADVGGWMDEELTNLLQQGGDLAVQLPKLLVYCTGLIPFPSANWAENERYSHYGYVNDDGLYVPVPLMRYRPRRHGKSIHLTENTAELLPAGTAGTTDWAYRTPPPDLSDAEWCSRLGEWMSGPEYDCLFHEHRGDKAFGCGEEGEEGVRGIIGKAWMCFDGGVGGGDKDGDGDGDGDGDAGGEGE